MSKMKILWCINPFQDERELQERCRLFLRGIGRNASVEPVYVSSPAELEISLAFNVPARERFRVVASERMRGFLKRMKGLAPKGPRIIEERGSGISDAAKALADYARREKADAIVLGTHARAGLSHFILGSYSETLLTLSRTPIVLIPPRSRVSPRVGKILFATDFSPASRKAFAACCRFAKAAGASVILQNVIEHPSRWITTRADLLAGPLSFTPEDYIADLKKERRALARPFLDMARKWRVPAVLRVDASVERTSETILKTARSLKVGLIALASQSGPLRAGFLGSVSRKVIHGSKSPVWLLRSA